RCPSDPAAAGDYSPSYFVITGSGAVFKGEASPGCELITNRDGMSMTLMVVEAVNTGIQWMEPRDLSLDDLDKAFNVEAGKSMCSRHAHGANVTYVDTHCMFLHDTIKQKTLRALFTYDGGEVINDDDVPSD
ncbi:MAG TPA: hypothetical protein VHV77_05700, partial [Pirellulales bacterium]|nr:hypothetical protein [Pirellulales bacterium]